MLLSLITATILSAVSIAQSKYYSRTSQSWGNTNNPQQDQPERTSSLLDFKDFFYKIKPDSRQICAENVYLLVLVQSKPEHFKERELIRETWGSSGGHKIKLKLIFLMGEYSLSVPEFLNRNSLEIAKSKEHRSRSLNRYGFSKTSSNERYRFKTEAVDQLVRMESLRYGDIVQGNFIDDTRNVTYKHLMAFKWVSEECFHKPTFVLKTDDNVFVEMNHLLNFLKAVYGNNPAPSLICDVVPAGTAPYNPKDQEHKVMIEFQRTKPNPKEGGYIEQYQQLIQILKSQFFSLVLHILNVQSFQFSMSPSSIAVVQHT